MTAHAHPLYLVTLEGRTADALADALLDHPEVELAAVCPTLADFERHAQQRPTALTVVDLDPNPDAALGALKLLLDRHPRLAVIVLCRSVETQLVLRAMRMGVRQFIPREQMEQELTDVLPRLLPQNGHAAPSPSGRVVTVLSAGGGCGATTIAANLAAEFAALVDPTDHGPGVLLMDLDEAYGGAATLLNVTGRFGLSDVLNHEAIDAELLRTTAVPRGDRLALLPGPTTTRRDDDERTPASPATHPDRAVEMLNAARSAYAWTFLDAPRLAPAATARLAGRSDLVLIVMQLCVKDVRVARFLRALLQQHGVDPQRVHFIANRYRRRGVALSPEEVQHALGVAPLTLANDYRRVAAAANHGRTLAEGAPRSTVRRQLQQWAKQWHAAPREPGSEPLSLTGAS